MDVVSSVLPGLHMRSCLPTTLETPSWLSGMQKGPGPYSINLLTQWSQASAFVHTQQPNLDCF